MGLDVVAFEHANPVPFCDKDCDEHDEHIVAWVDTGMGRSIRGLTPDCCYTVSGREIAFRAGSYSGYGEWREQLSQRALGAAATTVWANAEAFASRAFYELINFSDCQGTIGPEAAADLADDFRRLRVAVLARPLDDAASETWFMGRYDLFERALELAASGGGLVLFG